MRDLRLELVKALKEQHPEDYQELLKQAKEEKERRKERFKKYEKKAKRIMTMYLNRKENEQ